MRALPRKPLNKSTWLAEALLFVTLAGGVLALGGALPIWTWILAAIACATLGLVCASDKRHYLMIPPLFWSFAVGAALCLVQLVPLPPFVLRLASPFSSELREFALVPLGLTAWRPITLDAPATWRALAHYLAYGCLFLAAARLSVQPRIRTHLFSWVALCGVGVVVIGLVHQLVHAKMLFGLYQMAEASPPLLTPFANPNHLASFLTLSCALCLGRAIDARKRRSTLLWEGAFLICALGLLFSFSRGGIFFFLVSTTAFALLLWKWRKPGSRLKQPALWTTLGSLAIAVFAGTLIAAERLWAELGSAASLQGLKASKLDLWVPMAKAAFAHWRMGMGRGAFVVGFAPHQSILPDYTFHYPENAFLQLFAEFGAGGAVLVIVTLSWALWRLLKARVRSALELATLCGLFAVGLHDLLDFSLEMAACATAVCITLGALCGGRTDLESHTLLVRSRTALSGVALVATLMVLAFAFGHSTLAAAESELAFSVKAAGAPSLVRAQGLSFIDHHPADHALYAQMAEAYARPNGNAEEALAFVNRALFLRPSDVSVHRVSARALLLLDKREQAMSELRLAMVGTQGTAALEEAIQVGRGEAELFAACPDEPARVLQMAQTLWRGNRRGEAIGVLRQAVEVPGDVNLAPLWAERIRFQFQENPSKALALLDAAEGKYADNEALALLRAQVLWDLHQRDASLKAFAELIRLHPEQVEARFLLAEKLSTNGKPLEALEALQSASPFLPAARRAEWFAAQAEAYLQLHRPAKAAECLETAARLEPENAAYRYALGRAYAQIGRSEEAAAMLKQGMRLEKR